ncbi:MAG: ABC transporter permease, partial [Anaerolineae bacterium]
TTLVAIVVTFLLDFTIIGRHIYATGGNLEAARLAGIDVDRSKVIVYSLCGLLSGLAAVVLTARMSAAEPIAAGMYELEAIAAAVMGGTSLVGGAGSIPGTVIGALIMSMLRNGMNLFNLQTYYQPVAIGAVIVLAVKVAPVRKEEA